MGVSPKDFYTSMPTTTAETRQRQNTVQRNVTGANAIHQTYKLNNERNEEGGKRAKLPSFRAD